MMEEPGSLAGSTSSPRPLRGPEPSRRKSLAIFISETAMRFKAPDISTSESCDIMASKVLAARVKFMPLNRLI